MTAPGWLPTIRPWVGDEDGAPSPGYLDELYELYATDFIESRPTFKGLEVHPKRHPEHEGKCGTFWHVISQTMCGTRDIRPRRCERIGWIRPMIEATGGSGSVVAYPVNHGDGETRWEIALPDFSYVVVVAQREGHFLLWTAFEQETERRRRKARAKYEEWLLGLEKLKPPSR